MRKIRLNSFYTPTMFKRTKIFIFLTVALNSVGLFSQTERQRLDIIKNYDLPKLYDLAEKHNREYRMNKAKALAFARENNLDTIIYYDDGSIAEIQRLIGDNIPIYYRTTNIDASNSTRTNYLNFGGGLGLNLEGQNMTAYVWDGGHVRQSHVEFDDITGNDRVSIEDSDTESGLFIDNHATHVTGTISASGILANGQTKGMAPLSNVKSYRWNNDYAEAIVAATNGMLLSNHSYSLNPNNLPDYYFGAYTFGAYEWDQVLYYAPFYLMVVSAGNLGNSTINGTPLNTVFPEYDKLTDQAVAKNNLVVANAEDAFIDANGNLVSVSINIKSSQGPTDDLRIKPDITGNGAGLLSPTAQNDTALSTYSGTSMSSPNVMGSLLLLQQHYQNLYNTFMRASTLKGIALHTADDAGIAGPDANFGWGLLNTKKAAELISAKNESSIIEEVSLGSGETYSFIVESDGINDLVASISWTDPPGTINLNLNDGTSALVNDLDIKLIKNGSTYYPWRLTGVNSNANNQSNSTDNYERVDVLDPNGNYTVQITHKGNLTNGQQNFSLILSGITNTPLFCDSPQSIAIEHITSNSADLSWNTPNSPTITGYEYYVSQDGIEPNAQTVPTGVINLPDTALALNNLLEGTTYSVYLRTICSMNSINSGWIAKKTFSTLCLPVDLPYFEDFESSDLPSCWTHSDLFFLFNFSPCGNNTSQSLALMGGVYHIDTLPVNVVNETSIEVGFDIRIGCLNLPEANEFLTIQYWDGNSWVNLETINLIDVPSFWVTNSYKISSGLNDSFKIRFLRNDGAFHLDDVSIDNFYIRPLKQQIGLGTSNPKGVLDVNSINQPIVVPRVANLGVVTNGHGNPAVNGTIVYDMSSNSICFRTKNKWFCIKESMLNTPEISENP